MTSASFQLQMADGHLAEGRMITLKSVRIGRFSVEEVPCVVMDKSLTDAPLLLGGSFLNNFIVKLDPAAGELRLTEIKSEGGAKVNPLRLEPARRAAGIRHRAPNKYDRSVSAGVFIAWWLR